MAICNVYEEKKKEIFDQLKKEGEWDCMWVEEKCTEILCLRSSVREKITKLMKGDLGQVEGAEETHSAQAHEFDDAIQEYLRVDGKFWSNKFFEGDFF
jgi:hypothetical protein